MTRTFFLLVFICITTACYTYASDSLALYSPDKNIKVKISLKGKVYYSVYYKREAVINASPLSLTINNRVLGATPNLIKTSSTTVDETIHAVWVAANK